MLQFDLQFYEELTVASVRTVKFISGAFFWPTGQLVFIFNMVSIILEVFNVLNLHMPNVRVNLQSSDPTLLYGQVISKLFSLRMDGNMQYEPLRVKNPQCMQLM